jgi:transforming growth factor-beta-induced protein
MSRVRVLALPLIVTSLLLAACGDDGDEGAETTATTTAATEAMVDSTEAAPDTTEAMVETTEAAPDTTEAMVETTDAAPETTEAAALGTLVDVATAAGNFTTLLAAVEAAGLTETLATSKFTVLAPTDEAFAKVDPAALEALLADPAALTAVLQGHLLPLPQDAATISIFNSVVTASGTSLPVVSDGTTITIGGATVTQADIAADNGFIHVIDTVLLPAS